MYVVEKLMNGKSPKRYLEKVAEVPLIPTKKITLSQGAKFTANTVFTDNNMVVYNNKPSLNFTSLNYDATFKQTIEEITKP